MQPRHSGDGRQPRSEFDDDSEDEEEDDYYDEAYGEAFDEDYDDEYGDYDDYDDYGMVPREEDEEEGDELDEEDEVRTQILENYVLRYARAFPLWTVNEEVGGGRETEEKVKGGRGVEVVGQESEATTDRRSIVPEAVLTDPQQNTTPVSNRQSLTPVPRPRLSKLTSTPLASPRSSPLPPAARPFSPESVRMTGPTTGPLPSTCAVSMTTHNPALAPQSPLHSPCSLSSPSPHFSPLQQLPPPPPPPPPPPLPPMSEAVIRESVRRLVAENFCWSRSFADR